VGRRGTPYLVRSADDGDQAEWGVVRGMATLQDLEIGDEVTVTRSRLRDPSSRQATTVQIRGTVASVDGAGLTIIGGRTGRRYTLPVDEVVGIAMEDMVYPRLRAGDRPATLIRVYAGAQQADLDGLHRDGLITDREYQKKRAEILARI
jgi:hypothetical protein